MESLKDSTSAERFTATGQYSCSSPSGQCSHCLYFSFVQAGLGRSFLLTNSNVFAFSRISNFLSVLFGDWKVERKRRGLDFLLLGMRSPGFDKAAGDATPATATITVP